MKKAIVFGLGEQFKKDYKEIQAEYQIIALCDNNNQKASSFKNQKMVITPEEIRNYCKEDIYIYITTGVPKYRYEIINQLIELGIDAKRIIFKKPDWMSKCDIVETTQHGIQIFWKGVWLAVTNEIEEMIYYETWCNEEYNVNSQEESIVIDIGLNVGFVTLFFANKNSVKNVYSFEPDIVLFEKAQNNVEMNVELKNKIKLFNVACSNANKEEQYTVHPLASAGLHKIREGERGIYEVRNISCVDSGEVIGDIIDRHYGSTNIIVKCDCEGAEYEILPRLEELGYLKKIDVFAMEWHQDRRKEIEDIFARNGYIYYINTNYGATFGKCYAIRKDS